MSNFNRFKALSALAVFSTLGNAWATSTFNPDSTWYSTQLNSLTTAENTLQTFQQSHPPCETKEQDLSGSEWTQDLYLQCVQTYSDGLLKNVSNATAMYPNLSSAVVISPKCQQVDGKYIDKKCVQQSTQAGLVAVKAAIADIHAKLQNPPSAPAQTPPQQSASSANNCQSLQHQLDYVRQQLNQLRSSNFDGTQKRIEDLDAIIKHLDPSTSGSAR